MVEGGVHAVTFSMLKKAFCCPSPEVPILKDFRELLRPGCSPQRRGAVEVLTGHSVSAPIGDGEHGVLIMTKPQKMTS